MDAALVELGPKLSNVMMIFTKTLPYKVPGKKQFLPQEVYIIGKSLTAINIINLWLVSKYLTQNMRELCSSF